jgi:hypothetical protein
MVLIFLYGPPAVGKLTVARELAARTGFKCFHGHLTFDLACALFEPFTAPFGALCTALRLKTIELGATYGLEGMVFTYCYAYPSDTPFVERVRATVESAGGEVCFVQLLCEVDELKRRVVAPDRREFQKLGNADGLEAALERWDLYTPIPDSDTLSIDNTHLPPGQVAERIIDHFGLDADERR